MKAVYKLNHFTFFYTTHKKKILKLVCSSIRQNLKFINVSFIRFKHLSIFNLIFAQMMSILYMKIGSVSLLVKNGFAIKT